MGNPAGVRKKQKEKRRKKLDKIIEAKEAKSPTPAPKKA